MVEIPEHIQRLQSYRPGIPLEELARERGLTRIIELASNENPRGPSPKALAAVQETMDQSHRYPDPASPSLVHAISKWLCLNPAQIICGSGIDSLLGSIIITFSSEGDEILTSSGTFVGIYAHAGRLGRKLRQIPLRSWTYDLDGISRAISSRTKIIYLANPNNPTGTMFFRSDFKAFIEKAPEDVLVILDEAYEAYASHHPEYVRGIEFLRENLITVRTFSKVYGLAGLRVGYAVGHEKLIAELYKVRLPYEPSRPAQVAATTALFDKEYVKETVSLNQETMAKMQDFFKSIELPFIESLANFLMLPLPSSEIAFSLQQGCLNRGLVLRHLAPFGVPNGVRITTGTKDDISFALDVINEVWKGLKVGKGVQ